MAHDGFADAEELAAAVSSLPPADMERVARLLELYAAASATAQHFVRSLLAKASPSDDIDQIRARQRFIVEYLEARVDYGSSGDSLDR